MSVLTAIASETAESPSLVLWLGLAGFVAATVFGSLAWYNSKRPTGWKDKERPDVVPEIDK